MSRPSASLSFRRSIPWHRCSFPARCRVLAGPASLLFFQPLLEEKRMKVGTASRSQNRRMPVCDFRCRRLPGHNQKRQMRNCIGKKENKFENSNSNSIHNRQHLWRVWTKGFFRCASTQYSMTSIHVTNKHADGYQICIAPSGWLASRAVPACGWWWRKEWRRTMNGKDNP